MKIFDREHPLIKDAPVDPPPPPDEGDPGKAEVEGQTEGWEVTDK